MQIHRAARGDRFWLRPTLIPRASALLLACLALVPLGAAAEARAETGAHELRGYASWYAGKFQGRMTANGEVFDTNDLTAAHKTLPFNTVVRVTHERSGLMVDVRINDRGPFVAGRVIDLSRAAAEALEMTAEGIAPVSLEVLVTPPPQTRRIQIASFGDLSNARALRDRLVDGGIPATIEAAGAVHRVVVTGLAPSDVDTMVARLADRGFVNVLVRVERGR